MASIRIITVCTANQCRSPMAEALLRRELAAAGVDAVVSSCGELSGGVPATDGAVRAMETRGLDLSAHRSTQLGADVLRDADLVLTMARRHLREAVVVLPESFPRAFTLRELVRRGLEIGPRHANETFAEWLAALHAARNRIDLLGDDPSDDVEDPMGGPAAGYERTARLLEDLIGTFVTLAFPPATR